MGNVFPNVFPNIKPYIDDRIFSCTDDEYDEESTNVYQSNSLKCEKWNNKNVTDIKIGSSKIVNVSQQNLTTPTLLEKRVNMLIASLSKENYNESLSYAKLIKESVTLHNRARTSPKKYNILCDNDKKSITNKIPGGICKSAPLCRVDKSPDNATVGNRCRPTNVKMVSGDYHHNILSPHKRVQRQTQLDKDPQIQCHDLISRHGILHRATNKPKVRNQQNFLKNTSKMPSIVGKKRSRDIANFTKPIFARSYSCFSQTGQFGFLQQMNAMDSKHKLNGNKNHGDDGSKHLLSANSELSMQMSSSKLLRNISSSVHESVPKNRATANPRRSCLTNSHSISFLRDAFNMPEPEMKTNTPKVEPIVSALALPTSTNNSLTCLNQQSAKPKSATKSMDRRNKAASSRWGGHVMIRHNGRKSKVV